MFIVSRSNDDAVPLLSFPCLSACERLSEPWLESSSRESLSDLYVCLERSYEVKLATVNGTERRQQKRTKEKTTELPSAL
jgi:hypothetical protein